MKNLNWDDLRNDFFDECADFTEDEYFFIHKKPNQVFDWFKNKLNPPEESKTALEILESLKDTYYDEYLQCKTVPISTAVQAMEIYSQQQLEQSKNNSHNPSS